MFCQQQMGMLISESMCVCLWCNVGMQINPTCCCKAKGFVTATIVTPPISNNDVCPFL